MIGIYKITSPSGKVYIGQSKNIRKRINCYKNGYHKGQQKLSYSINKYGFNNHRIEILYEFSNNVSQNILDNVERYYIKFYKEKNISLNITDGGLKYRKLADETKKKLSESKIGRYKGNKNPNFGRKHSDEVKKIISEKAKARNHKISEKNRVALNAKVCKKCHQFTKDGIYINSYDSVTIAAKKLGVNKNVISNHIRGISPSAYGYVWKYD